VRMAPKRVVANKRLSFTRFCCDAARIWAPLSLTRWSIGFVFLKNMSSDDRIQNWPLTDGRISCPISIEETL
jgi:hypothetical protein